MNSLNTEHDIVVNVLKCNKLIADNGYKFPHKLFEKSFKELYSEVHGLDNLNESINIDYLSYSFGSTAPQSVNIPCNHYAIFRKTLDFIKSNNNSVKFNLNESIKPLNVVEKSSNSIKKIKADINLFESELTKLIDKLEKVNDFDKYDKDILKLKLSLNTPVKLFGFDVTKYRDFIWKDNLFSLVLNLSTKQIYQTLNFGDDKILIDSQVYDIPTDDIINIAVDEIILKLNEKLTKSNYILYMQQSLGGRFIEIYKDVNKLGFKYTDNLYKDNEQQNVLKQYNQSNIKK